MNRVFRIALSGVTGALLMACGGTAFASSVVPGGCSVGSTTPPGCTGTQRGSDLVLLVTNTLTNTYYAYDTSVTLDGVMTASGVASAQGGGSPIVQTIGTGTLGINATGMATGPNLAAFLTGTPIADYTWAIVATDTSQTGTNTSGNNRFVFSGTANPLNTPTNTLGRQAASNANTLFNGLNSTAQTNDTNTSFGLGTNSSQNGFYGTITQAGGAIGTAQYLFLLAGSGNCATCTSVNVFASSGTFTLGSNGALTYTAGAVPLPAAVWLLGSGLLGLVGISRRRRV